jgi:hypothetical protein
MATSMRVAAVATKGNPLEREETAADNAVVLQLLRASIDESGWKHEAVAAAMSEASGLSIDGPYLAKLLAGEKSWSLRHLLALPNDIEARFANKWASHRGAVVVAPLEGEAAVAALVGGLVGLLTLGGAVLPRCSMAKATLPKGPR